MRESMGVSLPLLEYCADLENERDWTGDPPEHLSSEETDRPRTHGPLACSTRLHAKRRRARKLSRRLGGFCYGCVTDRRAGKRKFVEVLRGTGKALGNRPMRTAEVGAPSLHSRPLSGFHLQIGRNWISYQCHRCERFGCYMQGDDLVQTISCIFCDHVLLACAGLEEGTPPVRRGRSVGG